MEIPIEIFPIYNCLQCMHTVSIFLWYWQTFLSSRDIKTNFHINIVFYNHFTFSINFDRCLGRHNPQDSLWHLMYVNVYEGMFYVLYTEMLKFQKLLK